jgi:O-antigen ligase
MDIEAGHSSRNSVRSPEIAVSLGLIAIVFLPILAGGYSGWGYLIAHVLLPLAAALCLIFSPASVRRNWLLAAILGICLLLIFLPTVYQGQVFALYLLCFPCAWIIGDTALRHTAERGWLLLPLLAGSATLCAVYGLVDWLDAGSHDYQITSFFGLHNAFAGFMLLGWPLGIMLASESRRRLASIIALCCSLLMLLALVLTYSRAAWVMFFLQLSFMSLGMLWAGRRTYGRALLSGGMGLLAVLAILFCLPPVRDVLARVTDFSGYSFQGRLRFWDAAWQIFLDHPLRGIGLGNFAYVFPQYQKDHIYYSVDPHSWVLQLICELGIAGLLLALLLIGGYCIWALRVLRSSKPLPWRIALVAALGGSLAHAAVDFDFTFTAINVFLAVLLAIGSHAALGRPAKTALEETALRRGFGPLQLACAALILLSMLRAPSLTFERFVLDDLRGMTVETPEKQQAKLALLSMAIRYNPRNHITHYQRASLEAQQGDSGLPGARADLDAAIAANPRATSALFLRGMLNPAPAAGSRDVEAAIELDPYNYPDHYYGWATLTDDPAEQLRRLELGMQRIPITEPVTPQHVRPSYFPLNGLFAQWNEKMLELTDDPEKKKLYRSRAAAFRTYYQNNQYHPVDVEPNI